MRFEKQISAGEGDNYEYNRGNRLDRRDRRSFQTSFVSHLLRRASEPEAERFEQAAHLRRELIEALAVTTTEADAGQASQAFAIRVSHGHCRQRRDDRDFS